MFKVIFSLFIMFSLPSCYVLKLAYDQAALLASRDDISEVISAEDTAPVLKKKLQLVTDILDFASQAGLNTNDAYDKYVAVDRDSISYVVFAAYPDRLELLQWWYPIVGDVPYRGYFDIESRDEKAAELSEQGYDIAKSDVDAYSSLGWFSDPVYSTMLNRRVSSLAHLLFHELVHRTYWLKNHSSFNESIAEFVAYKVTGEYLQKKGNEKELEYYHQYWLDRERYLVWLGDLRNSLKKLYASDEKDVATKKKQIFAKFLNAKPEFKAVDFIGKRTWNNARVAVARMYNFELEKFNRVYTCLLAKEKFKNAGHFLSYLEEKPLGKEPYREFYRLCK